jgi:hypothetical protein
MSRRRQLVMAAVAAATALDGALVSGPPVWAQELDADVPIERAEPAGAAIRRALVRYRDEPPVGTVVEAALRHAEVDLADAERLVRRGRRSGLLPTVRLGVRRGQARDLSALTTTELDRTNLSTDEELSIEASVVFRLDRLVYGPDEVSLLRERRALSDTRRELVRIVVSLYFERRRLQLERDLAGLDGVEQALRIAEIEALLDAFTGGEFERMIAPGR